MARKNKKKHGQFFLLHALKEETRRFILSILSFTVALFFLLAYMDRAGIVGETIRDIFNNLFGVGYFLFPLFLIGVGVVLLSTKRPHIAATTIVGGFLFFVSGLAIIGAFSKNAGGVIGTLFSSPFITLFDTFAAKIILAALLFVSLLILFDVTPTKIVIFFSQLITRLKKLAGAKQKSIPPDEYEDAGYAEDIGEEEDEDDGENDDSDEEEKIPTHSNAEKENHGNNRDTSLAKTLTQTKDTILSFMGSASKEYTPPPLSLFETDKGKPGVGWRNDSVCVAVP